MERFLKVFVHINMIATQLLQICQLNTCAANLLLSMLLNRRFACFHAAYARFRSCHPNVAAEIETCETARCILNLCCSILVRIVASVSCFFADKSGTRCIYSPAVVQHFHVQHFARSEILFSILWL